MRQIHGSPGAVILGGNFASVAAARNLSAHGVKVCVIDTATSLARFSRSVNYFVRQPRGIKDNELSHYLVKIAKNLCVRGWVLIPCSDEQLRIVAQNGPMLAEYYVLTTPLWETIEILYDKRLTYKLAQKVGVATPRTWVPGNADRLTALHLDFPVVLKPAISSHFLRATNRKAYRADNHQELQGLYETMSQVISSWEVIIQDFLPEPSKNLFSFAGYFRKGDSLAGLTVKRTRQFPRDFGRSSTFVEIAEVPELRELASQLLRAICYTGLAEIEFMWNSKHARFELLEVNARLWAWHSLAVEVGIELPYMAFADALGQNFTLGPIRQDIKWIRLRDDVRSAAQEIRSGALSIREYLLSMRGPKAFAVFSPSDPIPFLVEPFLIILNRLGRLRSIRNSLPFRWLESRGCGDSKNA